MPQQVWHWALENDLSVYASAFNKLLCEGVFLQVEVGYERSHRTLGLFYYYSQVDILIGLRRNWALNIAAEWVTLKATQQNPEITEA